jgi:hypothetical protein
MVAAATGGCDWGPAQLSYLAAMWQRYQYTSQLSPGFSIAGAFSIKVRSTRQDARQSKGYRSFSIITERLHGAQVRFNVFGHHANRVHGRF